MSYIILRGRWFHIIVLNVHAPTEEFIDDVKDNCYDTVNRWKRYFSQLFNVHDVSDVRQIEMHTAEPLVPG
jgi:hypothetical protein